jgi:hypothetical protein
VRARVLILFALDGCQPARAAPPPPGPEPAPEFRPAPPDAGLAERDAGATGDAPASVGLTGNAADAEPPATDAGTAAPAVELEAPYKLWERPRSRGEVYAAGQDVELARWNVGGTGDPSFISNRPGYHPATRVRVDVRVLSGRLAKKTPRDRRTGRAVRVLSEESFLAQARRNGYWPFRLCFEDGLRRDPKQKGETFVRVRIDSGGRVGAASLGRTRLGDAKLAECLVGRVRTLSFTPPPRRFDAELSIKLWPGDAPIPSVAAPEGSVVDNPGKLDGEAIRAVVADVFPSLTSCYADGLARDPGLWGRLELRVVLDERGGVERVAENESRFPDRSVTRCAIETLRAVSFAAPRSGRLTFVQGIRFGKLPQPLEAESLEQNLE